VLQLALIGKTVIGAVTNDDVIDDFDAQDNSSHAETFGYSNVF
jgi:hypothetical protein